jgi:hypothetical protein
VPGEERRYAFALLLLLSHLPYSSSRVVLDLLMRAEEKIEHYLAPVDGECVYLVRKMPHHCLPASSRMLNFAERVVLDFIQNTGWWTYKFCANKQVTQFHRENAPAPAPPAAVVTAAQFYPFCLVSCADLRLWGVCVSCFMQSGEGSSPQAVSRFAVVAVSSTVSSLTVVWFVFRR